MCCDPLEFRQEIVFLYSSGSSIYPLYAGRLTSEIHYPTRTPGGGFEQASGGESNASSIVARSVERVRCIPISAGLLPDEKPQTQGNADYFCVFQLSCWCYGVSPGARDSQ
jgi:hypothetical protein